MPKQDSPNDDTSDTNEMLDLLISLVMAQAEEEMFIDELKGYSNESND